MSLIQMTKLTCILHLLCIYSIITLCNANHVEKPVVRGRNVTLTCNARNASRIVWRSLRSPDDSYLTILAVCTGYIQNHCNDINIDYYGTIHDTIYQLTFMVSSHVRLLYSCMLDNEVVQAYTLTVIDVEEIVPPKCLISPNFASGHTDVETVDFTCESSALSGLVPHLSVSFGLQGISNVESSSLSLKTPLDVNAFRNVSNASCESSIRDLNENRTCSFPVYVDVRHVLKGHDVEFECDLESNETYETTWSLVDKYIGDVDIKNRSRTRQGGGFMLLQDITDSDVGRIVACKTFRPETPSSLVAVGFDPIYRVPTTSMAPSTEQQEPNSTPEAASKAPKEKAYIILTVVFIIMELITITLKS